MLNAKDIVAATGGNIVSAGNAVFSGVSIDSRTIRSGELFIALKGDRFDGHDFLSDALKVGKGAIVNSSRFTVHGSRFTDKTIFLVNNTLLALHALARYMRKKFSGQVIGVAGSNGKTTTKELIASILATKQKVLKTEGNQNNHIGMPLSIIRMKEDSEVMVLEMGTNRPGDIDELCNVALPDIGVVTNIGYEHLQGFGSIHKVRDSELEILPYPGKLVVNADDSFLMEGIESRFKGDLFTFGIERREADVTAQGIIFTDSGTSFQICVKGDCIGLHSALFGRFNVYNCIAAAAAAYAAGCTLEDIKKGIEAFKGVSMRLEVRRYKDITVINDSYNANPSSMEEAVKELTRRVEDGKHEYKRAVAVLGDMLELGDYGVESHKSLGQRLSGLPVGIFIGVGPLMSLAVAEFKKKGICADTAEEAAEELRKVLRAGDIILIKGSRGMRMEKVLDVIETMCSESSDTLLAREGA